MIRLKTKNTDKHCRFCNKGEDRNLCVRYMNALSELVPTGDSVYDYEEALDIGLMAAFCENFNTRK